MSELQMVLIAIGLLIIVAVISINWWQERKFHEQVERSFTKLKEDALLKKPVSKLMSDDELADEAELNSNLQTHFDENPEINKPEVSVKEKFADTYNEFMDKGPKQQQDLGDEKFTATNSSGRIEPVFVPNAEIENKLPNSNSKFNENLTQHEEIKAIFEEVFKQPEASNLKVVELKAPDVDTDEDSDATTLTLPQSLNGQIDLIAVLYLATETPLSVLTCELNSLLEGYDKPTFVNVLPAFSTNQTWQAITDVKSDVIVSRASCSMQLADRSGAVSRNTLNRFQLAVESAGLELNAHVEWQSAGDALSAAGVLDAFCIEVDKTVGFHLVHGENGAFTGTKLRGLSEAQGLSLATEGVFKYHDEKLNQTSFVMLNQDNNPFSPEMLRTSVVKGVTFQLDIPHVTHCTEAFAQMVQVARQMEIGLNAVLVDDNSKILGDIQIEKIRQQLKVIHAKMLVRGITPGSDSAHRLFT